jgi:hypothetical protein
MLDFVPSKALTCMKRYYDIFQIYFNIRSMMKYSKYVYVNLKYVIILDVSKNTIYIVQICCNVTSMLHL